MKSSALFNLPGLELNTVIDTIFNTGSFVLIVSLFHYSLANAGPSSCVDAKLSAINKSNAMNDRAIADGMKNGNSSAFRLNGDRIARAQGPAAARSSYATALTKFEGEVGTDITRMSSREAGDYATYLVKSQDAANLSPAAIKKAAQAMKREADELAANTYGVSSYDLSRYDADSFLAKRGMNKNNLVSAAQWAQDSMRSNLKSLSGLYPEAAAALRRELGL